VSTNTESVHSERIAAALQPTIYVSPGTVPTQPLRTHLSCRVLVVDDDDLVREGLSVLLRASHYQVELAATGEEALRVLSATPCNIVLIDWQMPGMDGLTLCREVRLRDQGNYLYVLMFTIRDAQGDMLAGFAAGADDYISKIASTKEILARLNIARRITHANRSLGTSNSQVDLSHIDSATAAHNLAYLVQHLPRELSRSERYGHALAVLTCDIDGFSHVNQHFGREAGDELLRAFVGRSEECIRKGDWLARTGSDEFMIVLPETTAKDARQVAQKLERLFEMHPLSTPADPIGFTVRIGVTSMEAQHDSDSVRRLDALLRKATDRCRTNQQLDGEQSTADLRSYMSARDAPSGGKNEIN
jgi:diguanylate cyclase (GGDEF)-like protein